MKKAAIIFTSAFIIEISSTFYIKYVSDQNFIGMIFFAGIGPFLGLPFLNYVIESEDFKERLQMAFYLSLGYVVGSMFVFYVLNKLL
jgi:hypothetical protein